MKNKAVLLIGLALVVAFAAGRFSVPKSTTAVTETSQEEEKEKNTHTQTTTTVVELPTGEKRTVTIKDTVSNTQIVKKQESVNKTETMAKQDILNLSLLIGASTNNLLSQPSYGISVSKEIAGPVTGGGWYLKLPNEYMVGFSAGVNF